MTDANQPQVILVDGSSYLFRAFHAIREMNTSSGFPTNAIRGVISMIRKLEKEYAGAKLVVVFDAKGKTFRNDLYSEYKANRPPMPDDLRVQIQPIHDIIRAMGLPLLVIEGVEADDVIGTLAHEASQKGVNALISTGDKDMAQLVTEHVTLMNTMTDTYMDVEGVKEKFGVPPERIIDYLALMGDKVDNIPGVDKCGPKTAVKWLTEFDSLEGVIEHADKVKGKVGENLRAVLDKLPLSYELATIRLDVELPQALNDIQMQPVDESALLALFKEYEFKTWTKELSTKGGAVEKEPEAQVFDRSLYTIVSTETDLHTWLDKLKSADIFAFDTETTSLNYMEAEIVGVSFAVAPNEAAYLPLAHDYMGAPEQLDRQWALAELKPLLEDESALKVGQNLKYDAHVLKNHGIQLRGIAQDTMLESYVLNSTSSRHDMDTLALKHLGHTCIGFEDIAGKGAKQLTFNQIELEKAAPYAAEDADVTLRLHTTLTQALTQQPSLQSLYDDIELPLLPVLTRMEQKGALVSAHKLGQQSQEIGKRLEELEKQAFELAGEEFNLGSPKQLQTIFFEKLELPVIKKTPKGQPSTAEEVLVELSHDYELPKVILEHRGLAKLKSTYTDKLPLMVSPHTGRIHTSYHQAVTATGRLSSTDPNLQNIPIRNEQGRKIRQAFEAPAGYKLIAADYSQIELRIMAHLSGDDGLLTAFAEGKDIHKATAAEIMGVAEDEVTSEQRRHAKAVNFGLIYGMSAFGLARQIDVSRKEAQSYINTYFERYPGVREYMDRTREQAAKEGYVETLFGRRLHLPEINSQNGMRRQAAERAAINAPMQGTAADIIKRAMIKMDQWIESEATDVNMIMQVHDELIFEVPEARVDEVCQQIKSIMEAAAELDVPLVVEAGMGDNWDQAH